MEKSLTKNNGDITAYGFACGYVQCYNNISLYKEHNTYHVRTSNIWESFDNLKEARAFFKKLNK